MKSTFKLHQRAQRSNRHRISPPHREINASCVTSRTSPGTSHPTATMMDARACGEDTSTKPSRILRPGTKASPIETWTIPPTQEATRAQTRTDRSCIDSTKPNPTRSRYPALVEHRSVGLGPDRDDGLTLGSSTRPSQLYTYPYESIAPTTALSLALARQSSWRGRPERRQAHRAAHRCALHPPDLSPSGLYRPGQLRSRVHEPRTSLLPDTQETQVRRQTTPPRCNTRTHHLTQRGDPPPGDPPPFRAAQSSMRPASSAPTATGPTPSNARSTKPGPHPVVS